MSPAENHPSLKAAAVFSGSDLAGRPKPGGLVDLDILRPPTLPALRQALKASKELHQQEMAKVTGGLNLPGMGF